MVSPDFVAEKAEAVREAVEDGAALLSVCGGYQLLGRSYTTVDGQPLGERKHWLHDDYVKFFRLAQWQVERSGWGAVGMVTNHGYLENTSFRGLRRSLLTAFTNVRIVDLHGNAKRGERSPDGSLSLWGCWLW